MAPAQALKRFNYIQLKVGLVVKYIKVLIVYNQFISYKYSNHIISETYKNNRLNIYEGQKQ